MLRCLKRAAPQPDEQVPCNPLTLPGVCHEHADLNKPRGLGRSGVACHTGDLVAVQGNQRFPAVVVTSMS